MPSRVTRTNARGQHPQHSFKTAPLLQLRVLYVEFLQALFGSAPPGCYRWDENDDLSEIHISDSGTLNPEMVGVRPAITMTRGALQFHSLGFDDMLRFDLRTGQKTKSVLVPGVMSINCCSRNDVESEHLAWVVAEHIWLLRETLMGYDKFYEVGRQPHISATTPAEGVVAGDGGNEWYCTTVASAFQFPRTSQFTPLNQEVVQGIGTSMRFAMRTRLGTGGPVLSTGTPGYPVGEEGQGPPAFAPGASDARGRTPSPGAPYDELPLMRHPLNPAVQVRVRSVQPHKPGLQPPSMGGRPVPIRSSGVEESSPTPTIRVRTKV